MFPVFTKAVYIPSSYNQMMPICPKCRKLISDKKYARHLRRCGATHKRSAKPLDHPENFFMKV
ncbi:MAG: hypothetical protein JRM80_06860 [Nitrososphaerota archaeon]|nr:hypothetical protein [Nitrososphaerota archaeon]